MLNFNAVIYIWLNDASLFIENIATTEASYKEEVAEGTVDILNLNYTTNAPGRKSNLLSSNYS